ncbi:tape measure protein [Agrobacterium sp. CG674]
MSTIRVELQLADGSFTTGMLRAGQSVNEFNQQLIRTNPRLAALASHSGSIVTGMAKADGATKGFLSTLRDVSIVTGLVSMGIGAISQVSNGFVGQIIKVNAEMERLTYQMKAMSTAKDPFADATRSVNYLREQAKQMPFAMSTITNAFVKLKVTGTDPMNGSLRALADGIASFGGDDQAFNRVVMGITQMSGKSVIQMEEMRQQLGESMPAAMQLMARSMGVSIAELTKAISTGRVESKRSLDGFYQELERSYGGAAQRMMQTFSGQVSQLYTNLQNLATNEGGRGFFDQVKTQLIEINQFLQSDSANKFATQMGQGLSTTIGWIRSTVSVLFEMRHLLQDLAVAGAVAFGGMAVIRGIGTFTSAIGTLRASFVGVAAQAQAAAAAHSFYTLTVNSGAPALVRLSAGLRAGSLGLSALATGFAAVAPWVAAIGIAVYTAGNYFGWFSNKVKEGYEEVKNYGNATRDEVKRMSEAYEKQLEERLRRVQNSGRTMSRYDRVEQTKELQKELAQVRADRAGLYLSAAKQEEEKAISAMDRRIENDVEAAQNRYREAQMNAEEHFNKLQADRAKDSKSDVDVQENRKKRILEIAQQQSKELQDIYLKEETALKEKRKTAAANEQRILDAQIGRVQARYLAEADNYRNLTLPTGVPLTMKPVNDDAAVKKGGQNLESLQDDVVKLKAEMSGVSGGAAVMWQQIQRGDYGQIEGATQATKDLHASLMAAATEKEVLDALMKGEKKAIQDIATVRQNILNKEFELKKRQAGGDEMTETEELLLKLEEGFYPGLGPIDKIREAVMDVTSALDLQGTTLNQIGTVSRENTFGTQTGASIDATTGKLVTLRDTLGEIGTALSGLDFSQIGAGMPTNLNGNFQSAIQGMMGFSGMPTSGSNLMSKNMGQFGDPRQAGWKEQNITSIMAANGMTVQVHKAAAEAFKGFLDDLVGSGYKINSLGGHNVRNKRGGTTLSEHAFGNAIDINPGKNPMGKNLITDMPANIREMAAKWGLSWGGDWKSVKDAMHFEWKGGVQNSKQSAAPASQPHPGAGLGLPALPTYNSEATLAAQNALIEDRAAATARVRKEVEDLKTREDAANTGLDEQKRVDYLNKIAEKTKAVSAETEKLGKNEAQLVNDITSGSLGKNRSVSAAEYQPLLAAMRELDRIETQMADKTKSKKASERDLEKLAEDRLEINRQIAEQQKLAANPDYKPESSALRSLRTQLDSYLDNVKAAYGEDTAAYREALAYKAAALNERTTLDQTTQRAAMNAQTREIQTGLMTQTQARAVMRDRELAELDRLQQAAIQNAQATGQSTLQITEDFEAAKAAVRAKYAQESSPLQKQMTEWRDIQGQMAQASAKWMDSMAGGITDLIMGTGDLKSVINGILKDVVNMGVKYMMSTMMQGKGGATSSKGSGGGLKKAATTVATGGKKGGLVPTRHTGGLVGSGTGAHKFATGAAFLNAPKFHTGGIIGGGLLPSEVPIIAQKGEGVFTPEQMGAMGGFMQNQSVMVNAPVTVNASGGTPEQNNDLANKMAKQFDGMISGKIADEMRKQSRPGNFANSRSR